MRILIAGGDGFLGSALRRYLGASGHAVTTLTRRRPTRPDQVQWEGKASGSWTKALESSEAVINACGYGLQHWPWTSRTKQRFAESRVGPGRALAEAIARGRTRPLVFVQFSGINRYGLSGSTPADETTAVAEDFLAQLSVPWEASTEPLESLGIRRVIARNGIVLETGDGLFPLMCLPARLFLGGRFGAGRQFVPWIHIGDHVRAVRRLLEDDQTRGAYNLVAPSSITNSEFMRALCSALHRPYWLHIPALPMELVLGEMSSLILAGRAGQPKRLLEAGFEFRFPGVEEAFRDLFDNHRRERNLRSPAGT
jgi:uncharacterized protein (TIGR01777 family)